MVLKNKLPKSEWKRYQAFTKDISLDGEAWIQLLRPSVNKTTVQPTTAKPEVAGKPGAPPALKTTNSSAPAAHTGSGEAKALESDAPNISVQRLRQRFPEQIRAHDVVGATATLDKIKANYPNEPHLWVAYADLAAAQGKYDEAIADMKMELADSPDNAKVVGVLARLERQRKDVVAARRTLQDYLDRHPGDPELSLSLASLQTSAEDHAGALKTLQTAADKNPDDRSVRVQLSQRCCD